MENNIQQTEVPTKKKSLKFKIYLFIFLLFTGAGIYGYFWFQKTKALRVESQSLIEQANKYEALNESISDENQRCENFISQKQGDFGSFEYCKKFIDWAGTLN